MPYSYSDFKQDVKNHIITHIPVTSKVLDIGPGSGVYSDLLTSEGYKIDCVEIHEPYVEMFSLKKKYGKIFIENILEFDFSEYDFLILGDVFEHLTSEDASTLLSDINNQQKKCLIGVPYLFSQGEEFGNIHETHHQPDLTETVMEERYPSLKKLFSNQRYGYYINYEF